MRQKIVFDLNIIKDIIELSKSDYIMALIEFNSIIDKIKNYHDTVYNLNWLNELENMINENMDFNLRDLFKQVLLRKDIMNLYLSNLILDNNSLYKYKLASNQPDKILISDNCEPNEFDLNIYNKEIFVNEPNKNNCILYRIPKYFQYNAGDTINGFDILRFYLENSSLIEIIDPYLLEQKNTTYQLIESFLKQTGNEIKLRFYYHFNKDTKEEYKNLKKRILQKFPNINILNPKPYNNIDNHDRFIIVNKDLFSIRFSCSFNNLVFHDNYFRIKSNFTINIVEGREYEDNGN